jgi:hypothetical protein
MGPALEGEQAGLPAPQRFEASAVASSDASGGMMILESVIHCPACGHEKREVMPIDACMIIYNCEGCRTALRPKLGDCCVFCSYGSVPCPSIQKSQAPIHRNAI